MTAEQKMNRIYNTIANVIGLPKVTINQIDGKNKFMVNHENVFVPDLYCEWDPNKEHFRIYFHIAGSTYDKRNAGYCVCTVGSGMDAANLAVLYSFFHKRRANNKEAAFAS